MRPDEQDKATRWCGRLPAVSMLLAGALAALATSEGTPPPRERLIEDPPPRRVEPTPRRPQGTYAPCPGPRGTIHRKHLVAILERGPGVFLGGVEVVMVPAGALPKAALVAWPDLSGQGAPKGGFGGWKVLSFHPGDQCLGRAGIRPGDVVLSANGNRLLRPEDLVALWAELRQVQNLVLRLLRGDEPLTFVVRVSDALP